jgi:aryl-alcohol dehydrogenase-like predicted oxidoreductase
VSVVFFQYCRSAASTPMCRTGPGSSTKNMMQAVEASLKRLQTDHIDLYWVHIWDGITPVEEVMRGLDDFVRQGKVLYIGISDAPAWWIAQANTLAELRGRTQFIGLQIEYSLIERTVERELIPMAKALNVGVQAAECAERHRGAWRLVREVPRRGKADGGRMFLWLDDLILCVRSCQTIGRRRNSLLPLRMLTASLIAQTETRSDSVAN